MQYMVSETDYRHLTDGVTGRFKPGTGAFCCASRQTVVVDGVDDCVAVLVTTTQPGEAGAIYKQNAALHIPGSTTASQLTRSKLEGTMVALGKEQSLVS